MNAWHHVAVTRTGMIVDVWVDGVKSATSYTSSLSYASGTMIIGCGAYGIEPYTGYIDDFRVTLGTRYTANFTPPSSAFEHGDGSSIIYRAYSDRLTIAPNPPVGRYTERVLIDPGLTSPSYYDGGTGIVSGAVTYNGSLAKRKVSLFTLKDKRLVEEAWSDPITGEYSFDRLKDQEYFVWSEDYLRVFDAVSHCTFNQTNLVFSDQTAFDPDDYVGDGKIWGTITDSLGNFLSRRVLLLADQTYIVVKSTVSNVSTGYYEFTNLDTTKVFTVVCESVRPTSGYNDIIRARVRAEVV